jgi:hypothetical protein
MRQERNEVGENAQAVYRTRVTRDRIIRNAGFLLIVVLGLIHVLRLPTSDRTQLSTDGTQYLAGSESIQRDGRYLDVNGKPQQVWPPGTSLLYATVSRITQTPTLSLVRWVNTIAFLLLALGCIGVANLAAMRTPIAWAMLAAVLCNGVIISMQNKLWSEPPTLALLSLLLFVVTAAVVRPEKATVLLAAAIAIAGAAILFRYAMLPTIGLIIAVALLQRRWWIALAAPLAVVPMALVLAMLGASRGERDVVAQTPPWPENFKAFLELADQVFPARLGIIAAVLFALCCIILPPVVERAGATLVASLWTLGYTAFLPLAQSFAYPSFYLEPRLLTPLYVGAIIATAAACENAMQRRSRLAIPLAAALLLAAARALRFAATNMP